MIELVYEGGWVMLPILLCSVIALAIVLERLWALRLGRVCPDHLLAEVWLWIKEGSVDDKKVEALRRSSPLGQVLATAMRHRGDERAVMKEAIEDTGRHVVHDLGRHLNSLGSIAAISPLLGLLGSVIGIMEVFSGIAAVGSVTGRALSGGIAEALITTAAGIIVAVPSLILYRYLRGKVEDIVMRMESDAARLIEALRKPASGRTGSARSRRKGTPSGAERKKDRRVA